MRPLVTTGSAAADPASWLYYRELPLDFQYKFVFCWHQAMDAGSWGEGARCMRAGDESGGAGAGSDEAGCHKRMTRDIQQEGSCWSRVNISGKK